MQAFSIGELAAKSGSKVETIRYYERIGLIAEPPRTAGGHRVYNPEHNKRMRFIRRSRELGFPIEEIRALIDMEEREDGACEEVRLLALEHLGRVRSRIQDLTAMAQVLCEIHRKVLAAYVADVSIEHVRFDEKGGVRYKCFCSADTEHGRQALL